MDCQFGIFLLFHPFITHNKIGDFITCNIILSVIAYTHANLTQRQRYNFYALSLKEKPNLRH